MSLNSNRSMNIPGWLKREVFESSLYYTSRSDPSTYQLRKPTTPSWFRPRCSCNLQEWLRIKTWYILKAHLRLWISIETLHKNMSLAKSNLDQHFQNGKSWCGHWYFTPRTDHETTSWTEHSMPSMCQGSDRSSEDAFHQWRRLSASGYMHVPSCQLPHINLVELSIQEGRWSDNLDTPCTLTSETFSSNEITSQCQIP